MDVIGAILNQWQSLRSDGAVLRVDLLRHPTALAAELISQSQAPRASQRAALQLLRPENGGPSRFERLLRVDPDFLIESMSGTSTAVVYFASFWQAMQALQAHLQPEGSQLTEAMAEEATNFRDEVLSLVDSKRLTARALSQLVAAYRRRSSDGDAWQSLQAPIEYLMTESASSLQPVMGISPNGSLSFLASSENKFSSDLLSALLLSWLFELREEYCSGSRSILIRSVRDILRCSAREACLHLSAAKWDLEGALRHHDLQSGSNTLAQLEACRPETAGWSTHGAKMRRADHECPICACDFNLGGLERVYTTCCFKAICAHCVAVLAATGPSGDNKLLCPFCRQEQKTPVVDQSYRTSHVSQDNGREPLMPEESLPEAALDQHVHMTDAARRSMRELIGFSLPSLQTWTSQRQSSDARNARRISRIQFRIGGFGWAVG